MRLLYLILLLSILSTTNADYPFTACTTANIILISTVSVNPIPVVKGDNVYINLHGVITEPIIDGSVNITLFYSDTIVQTEVYPLSALYKLPISPQFFDFDYYFVAPLSPDGIYVLLFKAEKEDGTSIGCIEFDIGIS